MDDRPLTELSNAELESRIATLMKSPIVDRMRSEAGYLPIWSMTLGGLSWFLADWSIKTGRASPKSPRLVKFGR